MEAQIAKSERRLSGSLCADGDIWRYRSSDEKRAVIARTICEKVYIAEQYIQNAQKSRWEVGFSRWFLCILFLLIERQELYNK